MAKVLDLLKVKIESGAGLDSTINTWLFKGNKTSYASSALAEAKSGVSVATKADLLEYKVINTIEQLVVAGVAERVVASGTVTEGSKVMKRNRHFLVARGKADDVIAEIKGTDAGVSIDGLTCKTANIPRNYRLAV